MAGHVARRGDTIDAYEILVGKPEGKITPRRPLSRLKDNIKMDLRQIEFGCGDRIY
jgi:hypothetical protein